jgi:hypothetical protein
MHHSAKLSRDDIEVGSALSISGNRLQSGDIVAIALTNNQQLLAEVSAFGLGRLVLEIGTARIELRPWNSQDDTLPVVDGPVSSWTVRGISPIG